MSNERVRIVHSVLGEYDQTVYPTMEEAGHVRLVSENRYGWEMPTDPPTERLVVDRSHGKVIVDLGCGLGNIVTLPCLAKGAARVFAWDVTREHVDGSSELVRQARARGYLPRLSTALLTPDWWKQEMSSSPDLAGLLSLPPEQLPPMNSVDFLVCRHSLQFGTPETVHQVFDLAVLLLKEGGEIIAINFTPYTGYMYRRDGGATMKQIEDWNWQFARGEQGFPGGFLDSRRGLIKTTLAVLLGRSEMDKEGNSTFIYFDEPTVIGLMREWKATREARGLSVDLCIKSQFYFTPSSIVSFNKLHGDRKYKNRENHIFILEKTKESA